MLYYLVLFSLRRPTIASAVFLTTRSFDVGRGKLNLHTLIVLLLLSFFVRIQ